MPIPIIGAAIVGVAIVGGIYKYFSEDEEDNASDNKNKKFEYGSTIIIGPQRSGKTHLANWLVDNKLLDEYIPTDYTMKIKDFLDYSGHYEDANYWENDIKDKTNIFYLFDLKKFINQVNYENGNKKYNDVVINQISFFTEHLKEKVKDKKIIIIGTHFDKIDNAKAQEIISKLKNNNIDLGKARIIYGSLDNKENAYKLEQKIINVLKEF
ncbi:MAG: hypothetical protein K2P52_06225 [Campylobacterales bacterium]|nr:hypothetical protein [Campylobacterales bacterium]